MKSASLLAGFLGIISSGIGIPLLDENTTSHRVRNEPRLTEFGGSRAQRRARYQRARRLASSGNKLARKAAKGQVGLWTSL